MTCIRVLFQVSRSYDHILRDTGSSPLWSAKIPKNILPSTTLFHLVFYSELEKELTTTHKLGRSRLITPYSFYNHELSLTSWRAARNPFAYEIRSMVANRLSMSLQSRDYSKPWHDHYLLPRAADYVPLPQLLSPRLSWWPWRDRW